MRELLELEEFYNTLPEELWKMERDKEPSPHSVLWSNKQPQRLKTVILYHWGQHKLWLSRPNTAYQPEVSHTCVVRSRKQTPGGLLSTWLVSCKCGFQTVHSWCNKKVCYKVYSTRIFSPTVNSLYKSYPCFSPFLQRKLCFGSYRLQFGSKSEKEKGPYLQKP